MRTKILKNTFQVIFVFVCFFMPQHNVMAAVLRGVAPSQVAVGEQFQVSYTISSHDVSDIRLSVPDAFECIYGPTTSTSSSFQMINGKTSSNESTTFTYVLMANKAGTYTLPMASCSLKGQRVSSNRLTITVSNKRSNNSNITPSTGRQQSSDIRPSGSRITGKDLFILVSADKRKVYAQEPVLLTYKVYTLVGLNALDGKMPDLKNFHVQEIKLPQQKSFSLETYNGKRYKTVTWSKYVIFPQVAGKLTIPSISFTGTVVVENTSIDPFEAFFNGGAGYSEVQKKIIAPEINLQVLPLPNKPKDFSGGVGRFSISASLKSHSGGKYLSGEPLTLRVAVKGNGNMKLMRQPIVNFPKDFDKYDAKVSDNTHLTEDGIAGEMVYEFVAVPRHKGNFTIPAVKLTYFDTDAHIFKTIKTDEFHINVAQGKEMSEEEREDLRLLNTDIRYIKQGDVANIIGHDTFFGSLSYLLWIMVAFLLFVATLIVFRKRAIESANVAKVRGKNANKVATKKLKVAGRLLMESKQAEFYDEVLRALWGYAGDKLNMPVEELSKENIGDKFSKVGIADDVVEEFSETLSDCEFARFAPGDVKGNMNRTYKMAASVISKIEKSLTILIFLLLVAVPINASTKLMADSAYASEDYRQAINLYNILLKHQKSADVYYNLGNAYYRCDSISRAILCYERALIIAPGDADIRFNLELARSKTIDRIGDEGEMFFVGWYREVRNMTSVDGWARVGLIAFWLMLSLLMLYLLNNRMYLRKIGFFGALLMLLLFVCSNIFAYQQRQDMLERRDAIIMSVATGVKSTPRENGTDLFVLHQGTKVRIIDDTMKDWKEVRIADGKRGWVATSQMERI